MEEMKRIRIKQKFKKRAVEGGRKKRGRVKGTRLARNNLVHGIHDQRYSRQKNEMRRCQAGPPANSVAS